MTVTRQRPIRAGAPHTDKTSKAGVTAAHDHPLPAAALAWATAQDHDFRDGWTDGARHAEEHPLPPAIARDLVRISRAAVTAERHQVAARSA